MTESSKTCPRCGGPSSPSAMQCGFCGAVLNELALPITSRSPTLSSCANEKCKRAMEESWAFCPFCGTDNRSEPLRTAVLQCTHLYFSGTAFCAKCGMPVKPFTPAAVAGLGASGQNPGAGTPIQYPTPSGSSIAPQASQTSSCCLAALGWILLLGGIACTGYYFLLFDTSVAVPAQHMFGEQIVGGRVNNIGLMADRQNGIIFGIAAAIAGLLMVLFVESQQPKRP
jgi:hypothetical protein